MTTASGNTNTSLQRRPDPLQPLLQDPFERRTLVEKLQVNELGPE